MSVGNAKDVIERSHSIDAAMTRMLHQYTRRIVVDVLLVVTILLVLIDIILSTWGGYNILREVRSRSKDNHVLLCHHLSEAGFNDSLCRDVP